MINDRFGQRHRCHIKFFFTPFLDFFPLVILNTLSSPVLKTLAHPPFIFIYVFIFCHVPPSNTEKVNWCGKENI